MGLASGLAGRNIVRSRIVATRRRPSDHHVKPQCPPVPYAVSPWVTGACGTGSADNRTCTAGCGRLTLGGLPHISTSTCRSLSLGLVVSQF